VTPLDHGQRTPREPTIIGIMSYDLVIWEGDRPADNNAAAARFDVLYERYLESEEIAEPPSPRIQAYVEALVGRYPDDGLDSPWAAPSGLDDASGPIVYLLMSYSQADELSEHAAQLASTHGLVCFDPQTESLRP
jgi:hypothetical protein